MEILMLVLFYYLSQNPDFAESVKPLMGQLKDSQQMLNFLNDLSKFSQTFSAFSSSQNVKPEEKKPPFDDKKTPKDEPKEKPPQSPTEGIADEFIQNLLDSYLKKH
jgi:hypothetical protein